VGVAKPLKKVSDIPVPSRDVTYQTLAVRESLNYSIPSQKSLVSDTDIPAGDRNVANLFYSVQLRTWSRNKLKC
jgi:hypothetical protein